MTHLHAVPAPAERCGHLSTPLLGGIATECVLRPGHQGSHADEYGSRWYMVPRPLPTHLRWTLTALPVISMGAMAALPLLYLALRLRRRNLYGTTAVVFACSVGQFAYLAYGNTTSQGATIMSALFLMSFWACAALLVWTVCASHTEGPTAYGGKAAGPLRAEDNQP